MNPPDPKMAPDKEKPPVLSKFAKRRIEVDSRARAEILHHDLIVLVPGSKGYDPCDNSGPLPKRSEDDDSTVSHRALKVAQDRSNRYR